MRKLQLGCAAFSVLAAAHMPQAWAFEPGYGQGTNPSARTMYADPDEQFDAMADSASGGSVLSYDFGSAGSNTHAMDAAAADHTVHWSAERIRTVFGPDAHY